jgi:hypothetical protein
MEKTSMKTFWSFLQPSFAKVVLLIIFVVISSLAIVRHEATSKVSWQEDRGLPYVFITIEGYEGPCLPKPFCQEINVRNFRLFGFLVDSGVWYLVSCGINWGYRKAYKLHKKMGIVQKPRKLD